MCPIEIIRTPGAATVMTPVLRVLKFEKVDKCSLNELPLCQALFIILYAFDPSVCPHVVAETVIILSCLVENHAGLYASVKLVLYISPGTA